MFPGFLPALLKVPNSAQDVYGEGELTRPRNAQLASTVKALLADVQAVL